MTFAPEHTPPAIAPEDPDATVALDDPAVSDEQPPFEMVMRALVDATERAFPEAEFCGDQLVMAAGPRPSL